LGSGSDQQWQVPSGQQLLDALHWPRSIDQLDRLRVGSHHQHASSSYIPRYVYAATQKPSMTQPETIG